MTKRKQTPKTKKSKPKEVSKTEVVPFSQLTEDDLYLFNQGTHHRLYDKLGAHVVEHEGTRGVYFAVWAPNARGVSVVGDFNDYDETRHALQSRDHSGIWEGFIPGVAKDHTYKYKIWSSTGAHFDKSDPFAFWAEIAPKSASVVADLDFEWKDQHWMETRKEHNSLKSPISIYEIHLSSWKRKPGHPEGWHNYRELAHELVPYLKETGFTHVELMPIMEYPFSGSWGYQITGYFAPTSRYGTPQDFMYFVDYLHQNGIGVYLDWVPSHFTTDGHGLGVFDGTHLYEHQDRQKGFHPDWGSYIFNYGRLEVKSFLISNAVFWFDKYHIDGLRVDAVASMLYLDYSRKDGEWIPNEYGGNENLDAIHFLRSLNEVVYGNYPDVQMIAEESTAWPMVSKPTSIGGLGFGLKWDMGWMHDTLLYFSKDPVYRKHHHNTITFRMLYAFHENYVLVLSHDEVVHGKGALLSKMPGDYWQQFANLRLLYTYMYLQPGKKLLFMGGEFGQWNEWNHDGEIDWSLLQFPAHSGLKQAVADLNHLYREQAFLGEMDADWHGFEWIDTGDWEGSTLTFMRKGKTSQDTVIAVFNFTPVVRQDFRVGSPYWGEWRELFNSDETKYGGSGVTNGQSASCTDVLWHGQHQSFTVTLPPLGATVLKYEG